MVNECKVLYNGEKGIMTFDMKKTVFLHRNCKDDVKVGLGKIVEGSLLDKGNYAFAVFENVASVLPRNYGTLDFFNNKGIPIQVLKGYYGDNVFVKEVYTDLSFIRAYAADDSRLLFYESSVIKNDNYNGPNLYYNRIDDLIESWEDITHTVEVSVFEDLDNKTANLTVQDPDVYEALRGLSRNRVVRLESGVIIADGRFESLVLWGTDGDVKMAWLGRTVDLDKYNYTDISKEIDAVKHCN